MLEFGILGLWDFGNAFDHTPKNPKRQIPKMLNSLIPIPLHEGFYQRRAPPPVGNCEAWRLAIHKT